MNGAQKVFRVIWGPQRFYLSMGWKTLIAFALVVSIPMLGLLMITTSSFRGQLEKEVIHDLDADLHSAWVAFQRPLDGVRVMLQTLAEQPRVAAAMAAADHAALTQLLAESAQKFPFVEAWIVLDRDQLVTGALAGRIGRQPALSASLHRLVINGGAARVTTEIVSQELFSEYGTGTFGDLPDRLLAQVVVAPVSGHGSLVAVTSLHGDRFLTREVYHGLSHNGASLAISMDHRIIATEPSGNRDWTVGANLPEDVRRTIMNGDTYRGTVTLGGRTLHVAADPIFNSNTRVIGGLLLATGSEKIVRQLEAYVKPIFLFLGVGMLLSLAIAYLAYRDIITPLQAIINAQNHFAGGDHDVRTELVTRDEFERLGEGFNRMASSVQESERRIDKYNAVSTLATMRIDSDELLERALDRVVEITGSAIGAVFLTDEAGKRLRPVIAHAIDLETLATVKIGEGLPGRAALERKIKRLSAENGDVAITVETGVGSLPIGEMVYLPLLSRGELIGLLLLGSTEPYNTKEFQLLSHLAAQVTLIIDSTRLRKTVEELAVIDSVTGVFNRQHFAALAERTHATLMREGAKLSALVVDIDLFGEIFDRYGFKVADTVLTRVAHTLRKTVPQGAVIARYSDHAFAILLPHADSEQAVTLGESIRMEIIGASIILFGEQPVTTSIGVATAPHGEIHSGVDLVRSADAAVRRAKQGGRNQVACSRVACQ